MNTNQELEPEVVIALSLGRKIEAIKILRQKRGLGLKEAKDLVDSYSVANGMADSTVNKSSASGLMTFVLIGVAAYLIYTFVMK